MKKIAVIGATGMLGKPVTLELVEAGFEVTALVRNPESAAGVLPERTRCVRADVRDVESLRSALIGQDAVYLSLSVAPTEQENEFHTESDGIQNILSAARAAGLKRVAYLSAMIVDDKRSGWWVLGVWRNAIAQIKNSGIPYAIFYATNFMETLAQKHVTGGVLVLTGTARHPHYWIAARDYGRQVARCLDSAATSSHEYFVQGPEPLTYDEAGYRYARNVNRKILVVKVPLPILRYLGFFSRTMQFNYHSMSTVLGYPEQFKAGQTWRELGRPSTTIEQFAKRI